MVNGTRTVKEAGLYGGAGSHGFNGRGMLVFGFQ
jgi:hypothetical protein